MLMKMSYCWFLFQYRPPVPRGFLLPDYKINFTTMKLAFMWISTILLLSGCSKNAASEKDTIQPVITLTSPVNGQTFTPGQSIQINGAITDDKFIAEIHIHVSNTNTGILLMDVHLYPGSSSTTFNQSIMANAGINYKIQVIAKDRSVNEARTSVEVSCN